MENKQIKLSMLSQEHGDIAAIIGVEAFMKLCDYYGGSNLYIPKRDSVIRYIRDTAIKNEFDGGNHRKLATKYNLSETHVRRIVANSDPKYLVHKQTDIFDFL
ncbi:Mor transcription activator family protein [Metasolibacillus meyeri]|uniref:Mor transcription activator family protein n=1 Tax=Metasolibacillus meyeri TaxID=1071052 RepID=A0AAW9NW46_9BACL|nr:Mor transcription activator family protein [Metasolibacillus meyeri]MEC1178523.1 Mor transcription activator family protein [Metasolibacillus meyeri]